MPSRKKLFQFLIVSVVLVISFINSNELYIGIQSSKQIWLYASMAFLLAGTGIQTLFLKRPLQITFNRVDVALLVYIFYLCVRAATTPFMPLLNNSKFINSALCILLYFIVKNMVVNQKYAENNRASEISLVSEKINFPSLSSYIVNLLILTGLGQAIWGLLQLYGITPSFNSNFRITGSFYNPAPYALYLTVIFPLALGKVIAYKETHFDKPFTINNIKIPFLPNALSPLLFKISNFIISKFTYFLALSTILTILLVLPATMIRAAWLGVVTGSLVVLQYHYQFIQRFYKLLDNSLKKILAISSILIFAGILIAGLFILKKGSSNGKLLIWEICLGKVTEKPVFGHGLGRFEAEYNNWQADYFKAHPGEMEGTKGMVAGNTKYCFNDYLELAAETGLAGLLLFLFLIALASIPIIKVFFNTFQRTQIEYISIGGAMVSILTCALVSFPFYSLPTLLVFFILLGLLSSYLEGRTYWILPIAPFQLILIRLCLFTVLVFLSISLASKARKEYKAYYIWDEGVLLYNNGSYKEASESFNEIFRELKYSGAFLQYFGKTQNLNKDYQHSLILLESAAKFTSDEILYTSLGDLYKVLNKYTEAEAAYLYASYMVPHKLFPKYLLANLYLETGQNEKALHSAEFLLKMKIKVESHATKEILKEMSELVGKLSGTGDKANKTDNN